MDTVVNTELPVSWMIALWARIRISNINKCPAINQAIRWTRNKENANRLTLFRGGAKTPAGIFFVKF